MRTGRAAQHRQVAERVAQQHGAAASKVREHHHAALAFGHRCMGHGVHDLDQQLVRRRVVVTAAGRALHHAALHLGGAIGNADCGLGAGSRESGDQFGAGRLGQAFAGHQQHAHRRQVHAQVGRTRRHLAQVTRHAPQHGGAAGGDQAHHLVGVAAQGELRRGIARQRGHHADAGGRRGMQGPDPRAVRGAREREQVRDHVAPVDAAQGQHVALEFHDPEEVVAGGHEGHRLAGRPGGVHRVPDGAHLRGGQRLGQVVPVGGIEDEVGGCADVLCLGGQRQARQVGQRGEIPPFETQFIKPCPVIRVAGENPVHLG